MLVHISRHGQVLPPSDDTWSRADYPPGDPPLSDLGRRQAHLLGQRLAAMDFCGRIYSSPYRRTVETACQVADVVDASVEPAAALREIVKRETQMQGFVGLTGAQLRDLHPRVRVGDDFDDHWWTTAAESDDDVGARVAVLVDVVLGDGDVLLAGHGASTGGAIHHLLRRCSPDQIGEPEPGWNCALTTFRCADSVELVRRMDAEHLPEDHITSNAQSRQEVEAARRSRG
jgi:broad specificity phosphatase PhoE